MKVILLVHIISIDTSCLSEIICFHEQLGAFGRILQKLLHGLVGLWLQMKDLVASSQQIAVILLYLPFNFCSEVYVYIYLS